MGIKTIMSKGVNNGIFKIVFTDGRELKLNIDDLNDDIVSRLVDHGLGQKVGDAASGVKGNIDMAFAECSSVIDALLAGDWNRRGEGGSAILLEAMVEYFTGQGKDKTEVVARYNEMDKNTRAVTRKQPQIAAIISRIDMERKQAKAESAAPLEL